MFLVLEPSVAYIDVASTKPASVVKIESGFGFRKSSEQADKRSKRVEKNRIFILTDFMITFY